MKTIDEVASMKDQAGSMSCIFYATLLAPLFCLEPPTIREHPEHEQEAIHIYRRILNVSQNSELLCKATRDLVYCYYTLGDVDIAKTYIDMLPSFEVCREYNLGRSNVLSGAELAQVLQNNIRMYATAIQECLEYFADESILKKSEMFPYSTQRAAKCLENIKVFLE